LKINCPVCSPAKVPVPVLLRAPRLGEVCHVSDPFDRVVHKIIRVSVFVIPCLDGTALLDDFLDLEVGDVTSGLCASTLFGRRIIPTAKESAYE
jgi:hypothetical protein